MKKMDSARLVRFSLVSAFFLAFNVSAQQVATAEEQEEIIEEDTETVVSALDIVPEILEENLESPVSSFLLKDRLEHLQNKIPLRYNEYSHQYVDFFVVKRASFTQRMLETKDLYFPIFEKKLSKHGLPDELKYLPLIESGLNPRIVSRAGAGGLWQFMRATGREMGLHQDQCIDERFHPEKSTEAACRYLKQLHSIFGDWEMALAAYNCGPGNIRRAIRRTGRSDFWGIYPVLPRETRNYVPQFVAMVYLMHYGKDHGIVPHEPRLIPVADTLRINGYLNLNTFAALGGMSMEDIYEHNPHLVNTYLPASSEGFMLKIPATNSAMMGGDLVAILDSSSKTAAGGPIHLAEESRTVRDGYEIIKTQVRHTVRRGQTLSSVAKKYGVTVSQLKSWNRMKGNMLKQGQRLVINQTTRRRVKEQPAATPVVLASNETVKPEAREEQAPEQAVSADTAEVEAQANEALAEADNAPADEVEVQGGHMTEAMLLARQAARLKNNPSDRPVQAKAPETKKQSEPRAASGSTIAHTVRKGETLISIAGRYGVEVDEIRKQNGLSGSRLAIGEKLQIATRSGAPAKPRSSAHGSTYHVVQAGDTLWAISRKYGLSVDKIKKANNIKGNSLKAGMKILISG